MSNTPVLNYCWLATVSPRSVAARSRMRLGITCEAKTLDAIAQRFNLSRERIRQIQNRAIMHAGVLRGMGVRRSWDHVHDTLRAALRTGDPLDPDLVRCCTSTLLTLASCLNH